MSEKTSECNGNPTGSFEAYAVATKRGRLVLHCELTFTEVTMRFALLCMAVRVLQIAAESHRTSPLSLQCVRSARRVLPSAFSTLSSDAQAVRSFAGLTGQRQYATLIAFNCRSARFTRSRTATRQIGNTEDQRCCCCCCC